jgi:DNA-directed RNA polymerase III subunit RPC8
MFTVTTVYDTIRIPPSRLALPTLQAIHMEIDTKYPNRVLLDVGLVISRYEGNNNNNNEHDDDDHGDTVVQLQHGACVAGDGGVHVACQFQLLVFRPFIEQVCLGRVLKQTPSGVHVTMGFFEDIFIPAYWMTNPSHFETETQRWIWTPQYDDDDDDDENDDDDEEEVKANGKGETNVQDKDPLHEKTSSTSNNIPIKTEMEEHDEEIAETTIAAAAETSLAASALPNLTEQQRFEMELGAEIRFRVKMIQYTQVTNTAKGVQSTTTSGSRKRSSSMGQQQQQDNNNNDDDDDTALSSDDNNSNKTPPPAMQIIGSICEDGLGLTRWWSAGTTVDENSDKLEEETNEKEDEETPDETPIKAEFHENGSST